MQKRFWNSIIGIALTTVALTMPTFAGDEPPGTGGPSDCEGAEGQGGDSGKDNSDPIYLASGDFQHVQQDLFIPGRGLDFKIKRHYRSRSGFTSTATVHPNPKWRSLPADPVDAPIVGINWDLNYNMRISFGQGLEPSGPFLPQPSGPILTPIGYNKPSQIFVFMGNGRVDPFKNNGSSSGENPSTGQSGSVYDNELYGMVLHFTGPGYSAQLIDGDMTTYSFYATHDHNGNYFEYGGRLKNIIDKNGNQISFHYETSNGVDRIDSAIDTLGHSIEFTYHDDAGSPITDTSLSYLLWKVEDHAGRVVEYEYTDTSGVGSGSSGLTNFTKLVKVTTPSIDTDLANGFILDYSDDGTTVDHGRFPSGRVWQYAYAAATTGVYRDGLISSITDPNGVAAIQNTYEHNGNSARDRGRVTRQQFGDDAYNYVVTDDTGDEIFPSSGSFDTDYYVWVNDRRGAITRFKYSRYYGSGGHRPLFHRQLLEKTEFIGFVANADQRVWATCAADDDGTPITWHYFDASGVKQTLTPWPQTDTGASGMTIQRWTTNSNWNSTAIYSPIDGEYTTISYDTTATDARRWGAMLSRTRHASGEADIIETWAYNFSDSLGAGCGCGGSDDFATGYKDGNGNITIKEFDTDGNLIKIYHDVPPGSGVTIDSDPNAPGSTVSSAASAIEEFTYNQWGQVLTHTHPEKMILDEFGNEVSHPRVDQFIYYPDNHGTDPANSGRLHHKVVDSGGENLTAIYEYNLIGHVIKVVDPGGDITKYLYNQASQLVRKQHFASNGTDLFAENTFFYDANGNLTVEETKNLDGDQNIVAANIAFTKVYRYDTLDFRVSMSSEHGLHIGTITEETDGSRRAIARSDTDTEFITQKWEYDPNRNLKKVIGGEAVNGGQSTNVITYEYDYRDLQVEKTVGLGEPNELVTILAYDQKGRLETYTIAPGANSRTTLISYDGFDRKISRTDPMGNTTSYQYDQNRNILRVSVCGPIILDQPSEPQALLSMIEMTYDAQDKVIERVIKSFDYNYSNGTSYSCIDTALSGSTDQVFSYEYNRDSSIYEIAQPSGNSGVPKFTLIYYDSASRMNEIIDSSGATKIIYNQDSKVTALSRTDWSTLQNPAQVFEMEYDYDSLNRVNLVSMDPNGIDLISDYKYDSRSNLVYKSDRRDNSTSYSYDSLGRLLNVSRSMTDTGEGGGTLTGTIVTSQQYDDSGRVVLKKDDNDKQTSFGYDGLGRLLTTTMHDSSVYINEFDDLGDLIKHTDARGVIVNQGFDLNGRLTSRVITNTGLDTDGSTLSYNSSETYTYDGFGRMRTAENDFAKVIREYDSRSNLIRELQNIDSAGSFPELSDREVAYTYDSANNATKIEYPGGREIHRVYDELNRLTGIFNDLAHLDPITEFEYIGNRLEQRDHGNGTRTGYAYNGYTSLTPATGDHGFGRLTSITTTLEPAGTVLDQFEFAWDKAQNRTSYHDVGSGLENRRERDFGYDSINRLIQSDVVFPDVNATKIDDSTDYVLDGVHNRVSVTDIDTQDTQFDAGASIGSYEINGTQIDLNQYSISPRNDGGEWTHLYDQNGNLILKAQETLADWNGDYDTNFLDISAFLASYGNQEPEADINGDGSWNYFDVTAFTNELALASGESLEHWHYFYDFRNQLVRVRGGSGAFALDSVTTTYTYDPLARRVIESMDSDTDGTADAEKHLVYGCAAFWEVLEEIDLLNTDDVLLTHVYGLGIDDEVSYRVENLAIPEDYWTHRDDQNSLTSITDDTGAVKERYEYGDYGKVDILDPSNGAPLAVSPYHAEHLYTGRPTLVGGRLIDSRNRAMDSELGRFLQIDPLGTWFDRLSHGNAYVYAGSSPINYTDPFGFSAGSDDRYPDPNKRYREWGPVLTKEEYDGELERRINELDPYNRRNKYNHIQEIIDMNTPGLIEKMKENHYVGPENQDTTGNCWRFACNDPSSDGEDIKTDPAFSSDGPIDCAALMAAAISSGALPTMNQCGTCPEGTRKVAGAVRPDGGDYHWWVDTGGGSWWHKPGTAAPRNTDSNGDVIADPSKSNNGAYSDFCGFICVPDGLDTD